MNSSRHAVLPFVFTNTAITADGKIAPANRRYIPFGSRRDLQHLLELRATADAVMAGARTVDSFAVNMGPGPARYRRLRLKHGLAEYNLRIIVSGSGTINPDAEIFRHHFSPIIILTTGRISQTKLHRLRTLATEVKIFGREKLNLPTALRWLKKKWRVERLLCEGGGELNAALFQSGLVDEVHLTICPVVFGGRRSPTLAEGSGCKELKQAAHLRLTSAKRYGEENFLVFRKDR